MKGLDILEEIRILIDDPSYSRYNEINQAYRKICKITSFNWLRESSEELLTFNSSDDTYSLDMSSMRRLQRIMIKGGTDSRWQLISEVPVELFEQKVSESRTKNGVNTESKPRYFKLEGGRNPKITVTPIPDQSYTVRVDYIKNADSISLDTVVNLPNDYIDTIAQLAAGFILERNSDPERKQYAQVLISRAVSEFEDLSNDSHPNRTYSLDRPEQNWIK